MQIQELHPQDKLYPFLLKQIQKPPDPLYVSGTLLEREPCFTVVGTRKPTAYGIETCKYFVSELCRAGFTIVSGLAFGIDAIAHQTALEEHGRTIAVLGSGPDVITPRSNEPLGKQIEQHGALVSELAPGTDAQKFTFPLRDRIMAGFSVGTLVIEAGYKSGALITARNATEHGRDVFCVPGQIFSLMSQGTNLLIQQGAKLAMTMSDILDEYTDLRQSNLGFPVARQSDANRSKIEQAVLACLTEPKSLDAIHAETGIALSELQSAATMLELSGIIAQLPDTTYRLIHG